ncbi:MAG: nitroreductase [Leptospiraceae bacterium]|nr:nitroreductase [Leptospiraceae bacterium]
MNVKEAILGRKSVRKFLPKEIEKDKLIRVLDLSRRAPTWKNAQAYKIAVVSGKLKEDITKSILEEIESGEQDRPDFPYQTFYPNYIKKRMLELGAAYYGHLNVDRKDKDRRKELLLDNFRFFGAPVAIFLLMEKGMEYWPTLDLGILLGTILLAAREEGLETIAQASLASFPDIIRKKLNLEPNWLVAVGLSIGYSDDSSLENSFHSPRVSSDEIIQFFE